MSEVKYRGIVARQLRLLALLVCCFAALPVLSRSNNEAFFQGINSMESISCDQIKGNVLCIEHSSKNHKLYGPHYPTGSVVISKLTGSLGSRSTRMHIKHGVHVFIDCSQVARLAEKKGREVKVHWRQKLGSTISSSLPYRVEGKRNQILNFKSAVAASSAEAKAEFICEACPVDGKHACASDDITVEVETNLPTVEKGDSDSEGHLQEDTIVYKVGADHICLSENKDGDAALVNNDIVISGYTSISFICHQDPMVPLDGVEALLKFNEEVIGTNGEIEISSLCQVPGDDTLCNVHYIKDRYKLGPITNSNLKQYLGEYSCTARHPDTDHTDTVSTTISACTNVPTLDRGKARDQGTNFPHSVGFKIGTHLVCLSENSNGGNALINSYPSVSDNGLVSFICQQDQSVELKGTEIAFTLNDEMIGIEGKPVSSSLCKDPEDNSNCNVLYDNKINAFTLGPVTNDNIEQFLGEYSCTLSHPDIKITDHVSTTVSRCSNIPTLDKGNNFDRGTRLAFSIGFKVGTGLVCLSKNSQDIDALVNGYDPHEEPIGYSAISLTCQQDPNVELKGVEAILSFGEEVIGINGDVKSSSLCPDPTDHSTCKVFYFEGGYVLGSITNDSMDRYIGIYTCTVGHPDVKYTDHAKTQVSECV